MLTVIPSTRTGRWKQRLDRVPPWGWLALQAGALWVHWRWAAARLAVGSDDPLGVVALVVLVLAIGRLAPSLRSHPRASWLAPALGLSVASTVAVFAAPPLAGALLAALALGCGLAAFMPPQRPVLPLAGLMVLALPVVSSLQFYAGYPLRLVTAQASTWLLQAGGWAATRSGTAMLVDGHLVIVDAPCSGIQLAWMAWLCACTVGAFGPGDDRRWLRRLPWIGLLVLAGNVVRNSVLVVLEARGDVSDAVHEAIGLAVLAAVCAAVIGVMRGGRDARA